MTGFSSDDRTLAALASGVIFAQTYFKSPGDPSKPLHLYPYQRQFINFIDFGYDIETGIKPSVPVQTIVYKSPRQFGKTTTISISAASQALRYQNAAIAITSISEGRAKDLLDKIKFFIHNSPFADLIVRETKEELRLANGSIIRSYPQSPSIRGTSNDWIYFDEAGYMPDRFILEDSMPSVNVKGAFITRKTPDIILSSTPPESLNSFFIRAYMNGLNRRELACKLCGWRAYVNSESAAGITVNEFGDITGRCPSCRTDGSNLTVVHNSVASLSPSPFDHPLISKEALLAKIDSLGNTPAARREWLGEIVGNSSSLIREEWIRECTDQRLMNTLDRREHIRYSMGVDYGRVKDATVFCVGHKDGNMVYLDYIRVIPGKGGHTYEEIRSQFISVVNTFAPFIIVPDSTGIGNPLVEQMQTDLVDLAWNGVAGKDFYFPPNPLVSPRIYSNKRGHLGFYFDYNAKLDLMDNLINLFQLNFIRIPPPHIDASTQTLHRELAAFNYTETKNGRIKFGVQAEHDDTVIALALMAWGLRESSYVLAEAAFGGEDNFIL